MNRLVASNIGKVIRRTAVLQDINLDLTGGNVYAFCGENGSGKTMLFRVLSGLSRPRSGQVLYNGTDLNAHKRPFVRIGVTIENISLYPQFTGWHNLYYLSKINKLTSLDGIASAMRRVGLDPADKRIVGKYSLGMRQRLVIAQAVMEQPDFLFLDEPTNAIDKDGVSLIHDIIRQEAERGAVVLIASHIDADISRVADMRFTMREGRIHHD